jgi:hypothetical protein
MGANAFNGILFMNSKKSIYKPRDYRLYAKLGQNQPTSGGTNDYVDYGIRMAHAFSQKLAKVNFTYMEGQIGLRRIMMTEPM